MESKVKEVILSSTEKMQKSLEHLEEDLVGIRAGKASPALFNSVMVDYYGSPTPLPQIASVTSPDARTIMIQPWEKTLIPTIEKAILLANLGFNPQNNGESIRINIPALTEERRKDLVKQARSAGENTRIGIRNIRRDAIEMFKKFQKDGLAEDLTKDAEASIQKITDDFNKKVDSILDKKEKDIMAV